MFFPEEGSEKEENIQHLGRRVFLSMCWCEKMSVAYSAWFSSLARIFRSDFSKNSHQNALYCLYKYADCIEKSPCHCVVEDFSSVGQWGNSLSFLLPSFPSATLEMRVEWGIKLRIRSNGKAPHSHSFLFIFKRLWGRIFHSGSFIDEVRKYLFFLLRFGSNSEYIFV